MRNIEKKIIKTNLKIMTNFWNKMNFKNKSMKMTQNNPTKDIYKRGKNKIFYANIIIQLIPDLKRVLRIVKKLKKMILNYKTTDAWQDVTNPAANIQLRPCFLKSTTKNQLLITLVWVSHSTLSYWNSLDFWCYSFACFQSLH